MNDSVSGQKAAPGSGWTPTTKLVVGIAFFVLLAIVLVASRAILTPLIIALIVAYLLHPVVESVSSMTRIPHKVATGLIYLIVLAGVIVLGAVLTPVVVEQASYLPAELRRVINYLLNLSLSEESIVLLGIELEVRAIVNEVGTALLEAVPSVTDIVSIAFDVAEALLLTIFVFLMAFYLTRDAAQIRTWIRGLVPPGFEDDSDRLLAELDAIWSAFFRGQLILALVVMVIITVVAAIIGLPQPMVWGVFAGLMEFLPSVGHAIFLVAAVLVALVEGSATLPISNAAFALVVVGVHTVYTQVDLNYLIPRIVGAQVHLHPMVVIIGIIVGASIGGVLGVALAAPVIASARALGGYVYRRIFEMEPFEEEEVPVDLPPDRQPVEAASDGGQAVEPEEEAG